MAEDGIIVQLQQVNQALGTKTASASAHPTVLSDVEFAWEDSTDLIRWQPSQAKRLVRRTNHSFWATEFWFFRVDSAENKFVRLVMKQQTQ